MKDFRENCIRVARGDTPSGRSWAGVSASGLPDDLVEKVVRRLGWVALLAILTTLLVHFLGVALFGQLAAGMKHSPLMTPSLVVMVGASVVVLALAWSCRVPAYLMLDLGLLYEVAGALGISLLETCMPLPPPLFVRGISWVALWITVFALVIPNTPGKTALASFAAATMGPLAYLIQMAVSGHPAPNRAVFVMAFLGNYVAAVWAVLLGRIVYRLGRDMGKAREMGSYTLLEPIGKGGMGEVWRAKHRMLARTSAIKVIRPEMCHQDQQQACTMLARFHREVQATATLRSPHTVELYDFGNTDDGSFYYVMELLDGLDMERLVQRFGPLPAARVVYLLRQACASLAEAHANGLTHRDIKPKNIFVCRLGLNYDFVKVLDFGLVKVDMAKDETLTQLTRDGVTTGTPAYMAPEMALGKAVDARTDLYALGCVGYWLLTGQLVFEEDSAMAMALAHVQKAPTPPSQRTEIEVPMDLERILLWCLEKNPERRPQSARDLSMSLAACRAGEPWANERAEQWWRLHMAGSEPAPAPLDSQAVTQSM